MSNTAWQEDDARLQSHEFLLPEVVTKIVKDVYSRVAKSGSTLVEAKAFARLSASWWGTRYPIDGTIVRLISSVLPSGIKEFPDQCQCLPTL